MEKCETLNIIGPNACGKSTLLQVVSGILQPTTGRVVTRGRIAALLHVIGRFDENGERRRRLSFPLNPKPRRLAPPKTKTGQLSC